MNSSATAFGKGCVSVTMGVGESAHTAGFPYFEIFANRAARRAGSGETMAKAANRQGRNTAGKKAAKAGPKSRRRDNTDMEQASVYRQRLGRLTREAVLFASAAITLFLLAALISYSPADPGWSTQGNGLAIHNLLGAPGAWFADVLLSLFGYLGYIAPLLVLYGGWLVFEDRELSTDEPGLKALRGVALLFCLLSASALTTLLFSHGLHTALPQGSGGYLGIVISHPVAHVINILGAGWLFITIF